ncbi:MAG: hypothetical protein ACI3V5_05260 [Faecousia sp.]
MEKLCGAGGVPEKLYTMNPNCISSIYGVGDTNALSCNACVMGRKLYEIISKYWIFPTSTIPNLSVPLQPGRRKTSAGPIPLS